MQKIGFYFFFGFIWIIALLPLQVLYLLSDFLYLIVYYVVKYRRAVTHNNLLASFPEKSSKEIKRIEKKFYHHFCDSFIETVKQLHFSEKALSKRITIQNMEVIDELYAKGKSIILYLGHYGNWEWLSILNRYLENKRDFKFRPIYQILTNSYFDALFIRLRNTFGGESLPQSKVLRKITQLEKEKSQSVFVFLSDQRPGHHNIHHWMTFLNQDSPTVTGTERIAKQTNYSAVYLAIKKTSRGHYRWEFSLMSENPKEIPDFKLTEQYMSLLENTIREAPEYYLWTHKRWLHKRKQ